jgi:hypothetical protein
MLLRKEDRQTRYDYHRIQYYLPFSGEIFTIGAILKHRDGRGYSYYLPTSLDVLDGCIDIGDKDGAMFAIEVLKERLESGNLRVGAVSNSMAVETEEAFFSDKTRPEEVLHDLCERLMPVVRLRPREEEALKTKYFNEKEKQ